MAFNYGRRTRQNYERKSILDVVQQNFSYFDRNTFIHRLIYVGELATVSSDADLDYTKIIDGFQRTVKPINDRYCDERVSGFLLCYGHYFCHVLESSEESLMRHLKLLEDCEHVCFANLKLITVFHHMNQRFVDEWVPLFIKTPLFLTNQDEVNDLKQTADKIKSTIDKLYQIGQSLKSKLEESKVKVRSSARQKLRRKSPTPRHVNINVEYQFLPQYKNLQFLVNSPFTRPLKDYLRLYDRLTLDESEDDVWPIPTNHLSTYVFETEKNPVTDLPQSHNK